MAVESYANNFGTTLAAPMLVGDLTATVTAAAPAALQAGQFRIVIGSEILLVTAGADTTTWTVTRGVEGTTPAAHAGGATVTHVLTAASLAGAATQDATVPSTQAFGDAAAAGSATAAARRDHVHGMPAAGVAISALPAVVTPATTDEFVVNQAGTTKKVTLAQFRGLVDTSDFRSAVLATGPSAYFRFGEAAGTVAKDECRASPGTYVNTPTLGTAGLVVGDGNAAITLAAASSEYVSFGATAALRPIGDFSLMMLIQTSTVSTYLVSTRPAGSLDGYELGIPANGKVHLYIGDNGGSHYDETDLSAASVADGARHLVFVTRSGTTLTGYVDALAAVPYTAGDYELSTGNLTTILGARAYDLSAFYNGVMDEFAFWQRALTADEITNLELLGRGL